MHLVIPTLFKEKTIRKLLKKQSEPVESFDFIRPFQQLASVYQRIAPNTPTPLATVEFSPIYLAEFKNILKSSYHEQSRIG